MSRSFRLILPLSLYQELVAQAKSEAPLECCGLLAGTPGTDGTVRVVARFPLVNAAASPVRYESEPRSMFDAVRAIDRAGLEIVAIYHSHPTSPPVPSKIDLAQNFSEDVLNLILGLTTDPPLIRAWWLTTTDYREGELTIETDVRED